MELPQKAVIIGVSLRDLEKTHSSQHIFADVVLIDKSHASLEPLLYQVKDDVVKEQEGPRDHSYMPIERDAFMMVGQVLSINKKKKQIYLKGEITVSYKHLILASGLGHSIHDDEFAAGLHALTEALRVRKNIPCGHCAPRNTFSVSRDQAQTLATGLPRHTTRRLLQELGPR